MKNRKTEKNKRFAELGRLGGTSLFLKVGKEGMAERGRKGMASRWKKLSPV